MTLEQRQIQDTIRQLWELWHHTNHYTGREAILTAITELSRKEEELSKIPLDNSQ